MSTWPLLVAPEADESWLSYLRRTSRAYGMPLLTVARRLAVTESVRFPSGFTLAPSEATRAAWQGSPGELDEMFLALLAHVYGTAWQHLELSRFSRDEWLHVGATPVCPACLTEGAGHWRLSWHVPFVFMCVEHERLLSQDCPECGRPHGTGRRDGSVTPSFLNSQSDTRTCMNPADSVTQAHRVRSLQPCGADLTATPTPAIRDLEVVAAQALILRVLRGDEAPTSFGHQVSVRAWFADLRALMAWILYAGPVELARDMSDPFASAWALHCAPRDEATVARRGTKGSIDHSLSRTPSPVLVGSTAPIALDLLGTNLDAVPDRLREFGERMVDRSGRRRRVPRLLTACSMSLRSAVHEASYGSSSVKTYLAAHPHRPAKREVLEDASVDVVKLRASLPKTMRTINAAGQLPAFRTMVRFFRDPSAKTWSDAEPDQDPERVAKSVMLLVNAASKHDEARSLAHAVVESASSLSPRAPALHDRGDRDEEAVDERAPDASRVPTRFFIQAFVKRFRAHFRDTQLGDDAARDAVSVFVAAKGVAALEPASLGALGRASRKERARHARVVRLLSNVGTLREVRRLARREAMRLQEADETVDFEALRRKLVDYTEVDWMDWLAVSAVAGNESGRKGGRNRTASALVWAAATQADWRLAPVFYASQPTPPRADDQGLRLLKACTPALEEALDSYASYVVAGGEEGAFHAELARARRLPFEPRHVPQLFWREPFLQRFKALFEDTDIKDVTARATLSVLLLQHVMPAARPEVAVRLGFDARNVRGGIARAAEMLASHPGFLAEWSAFIDRFTAQPTKVDYARKREQLQRFTEVPWSVWTSICEESGVRPGRRGGMQRYGAAWLWGELTEGDPLRSPSASDLMSKFARNSVTTVYGSFREKYVAATEVAMRAWATRALLAQSCEPVEVRPLHNPLERQEVFGVREAAGFPS